MLVQGPAQPRPEKKIGLRNPHAAETLRALLRTHLGVTAWHVGHHDTSFFTGFPVDIIASYTVSSDDLQPVRLFESCSWHRAGSEDCQSCRRYQSGPERFGVSKSAASYQLHPLWQDIHRL